MKAKLEPPIFIFGCPRSGTTLLQSILATHPEIASFPETKFFLYGVAKYEPKRQKFGLISRRLKPHLNQYFKYQINHPEMLKYFPKVPILDFINLYTRSFIKVLNILTIEEGKSLWLEKTPDHLLYLDYIEKMLPEARMIHLLRNGSDVVASLYEVTHKYPEPWGGDCWSLNLCIRRWVEAVEITRQHIHKPNHILVRYEDIITNPQAELLKLCQFIGINFTYSMLQNYLKTSEKLSLESAGRTVKKEITNCQSEKFQKLFNESEREYIIKGLSKVDLSWVNDFRVRQV